MVLVLKKNFEKRLKDTQRAPEGRFLPGYHTSCSPDQDPSAAVWCPKAVQGGKDRTGPPHISKFPPSSQICQLSRGGGQTSGLLLQNHASDCFVPRAREASTRPQLQKKSLPKPQLLATQRETWNTEKSWYGQRATDPKPRSFQTELNMAQAAPRLRAATPAYRSSNTWLTEQPSCHLPAAPELPVLLKALGYSSRDTTQL